MVQTDFQSCSYNLSGSVWSEVKDLEDERDGVTRRAAKMQAPCFTFSWQCDHIGARSQNGAKLVPVSETCSVLCTYCTYGFPSFFNDLKYALFLVLPAY